MAAPDYVPVTAADRVRAVEQLPPARRWVTDRPGEIAGLVPPSGTRMGNAGPDQGYALKLATQFTDRLQLGRDEHAADAVAGCLGVALKRAALFGRAPVVFDLELAFILFGFLGDAPDDLIAVRAPLFAEASHHYWEQRHLADVVPEATLRLTPAEVRARLSGWRDLLEL
ncbi:MAG: hypothetical protein ACR2H3_05085 [Acidimicrobiales bacterium]